MAQGRRTDRQTAREWEPLLRRLLAVCLTIVSVTAPPRTALAQQKTRVDPKAVLSKTDTGARPQVLMQRAVVVQPRRMPDVVGMTEAEARRVLLALRLAIRVEYAPTQDQAQSSRVAEQNPKAGENVLLGSVAALNVNRYQPPTTRDVPQVVTLSVTEATRRLKEAGFVPQVPPLVSYEGYVVTAQKPEGGTPAPVSSVVALSVRPQARRVPALVGRPHDVAVQILRRFGFAEGPVRRAYDEEIAGGVVLSQSPAAGDSAVAGSAVDLVVSLGPHPPAEELAMPGLRGLTRDSAIRVIGNLRLRVGDVSMIPHSDFVGRVVSHSPPVEARVHVGDRVNLVIGAPPAPTTGRVPNVVGMARASAERVLRDSGFRYETTVTPSDTATTDRVVQQSPQAGATLPLRSRVDLTVMERPAGVQPMPSVLGLVEDDARRALTFIIAPVSIEWAPTSRAADSARVTSQLPVPGAAIASGRPIVLTLGLYTRPTVRVADVVGRTVADARRILTDSSLHVVVRLPPGVNQNVVVVAGQRPAAGMLVAPHSAVRLTVEATPDPAPGPEPARTQVPNLIGRSLADARRAIDSAHLRLVGVRGVDTSRTASVKAQSPAGGTVVLLDTPVSIDMTPPPTVAVPFLVGRPLREAVIVADAAGFPVVAGEIAAFDSTVRVTSQRPQADARVAEQTPILVELERAGRPWWVFLLGGLGGAGVGLAVARVLRLWPTRKRPPQKPLKVTGPRVWLERPTNGTECRIDSVTHDLVKFAVELRPGPAEHTVDRNDDMIAEEREVTHE